MILAMGFGIRLRSRLLRLADLAIRRGQIGLGLGDILLRLRQSRLIRGNRLIRGGQTVLIGFDVGFRRSQLLRQVSLSRLVRGDILLSLNELRRIVGQSLPSVRQVSLTRLDIGLRLFQLFRRISQSRLVRGNRLVRLGLLSVDRILSRLVILDGLAKRLQRRVSRILLFSDCIDALSVRVDLLRRGIQIGTQLGLLALQSVRSVSVRVNILAGGIQPVADLLHLSGGIGLRGIQNLRRRIIQILLRHDRCDDDGRVLRLVGGVRLGHAIHVMRIVIGDGPNLDHITDRQHAGGKLALPTQLAQIQRFTSAIRLRIQFHMVEIGGNTTLKSAVPLDEHAFRPTHCGHTGRPARRRRIANPRDDAITARHRRTRITAANPRLRAVAVIDGDGAGQVRQPHIAVTQGDIRQSQRKRSVIGSDFNMVCQNAHSKNRKPHENVGWVQENPTKTWGLISCGRVCHRVELHCHLAGLVAAQLHQPHRIHAVRQIREAVYGDVEHLPRPERTQRMQRQSHRIAVVHVYLAAQLHQRLTVRVQHAVSRSGQQFIRFRVRVARGGLPQRIRVMTFHQSQILALAAHRAQIRTGAGRIHAHVRCGTVDLDVLQRATIR